MTDTTTTTDTSEEVARLTQAVSDANAEAAKYRVEKKDAVEAAKQEVTESFNARIAELEAELNAKVTGAEEDAVTARTDAAKLRATIKAGIDTEKALDFAELLKGETEDELVSHAETLKGLFSEDKAPVTKQGATDPTQGQVGKNTLPLNGDPLLAAITKAVNR